MDKSEIRAILSAYRAGDSEMEGLRFQQAKAAAEADAELAQWWAEHQELDRVISSTLQNAEVPRDLKARVTAWEKRTVRRGDWNRRIMAAAATIVALAVWFGSWRGPFQPAASLAEYRDEMVSFIKIPPAIELETDQLPEVTAFLARNGMPSNLALPGKLRELQALGCRTLRFRGHDVGLLCFEREDGRELHLFVVDQKALPDLPRDGRRDYSAQGNWMTAAWVEGDLAYLITVEGDRVAVEKYLTSL